jgi:HEAT repeat protein
MMLQNQRFSSPTTSVPTAAGVLAPSGCALLLLASLAFSPLTAPAAESSAEKQTKLISVLQSDAPPQEKAITCKKLAIYGTKDAVPALAPLLADKDLASWARIALEAIPDPAAGQALIEALGRLQGRLLVGVINSIGVRREAGAVTALTQKLADADVQVVAAAAAALGYIGGTPAAQALESALASAPAGARAEVAEGCVRCAERFLANGNAPEAIRLYDLVRKANVPKQKILEATRGAILARGPAGLPLLLEQLRSTDPGLLAIGLRTARELPGREVTAAVAAEVDRSDLDRQTLLVMVLADRGDPTVLPTIRKAAQTGPKPMRLAAIKALERMGTVACVPVLLDLSVEDDAELAQPARAALVRLPGQDVNADLIARLPQADVKQRRVLVELVGQRRLAEALPAVARCAGDADAGVRSAAVSTIGILGDENQAGDLAKLLATAQNAKDRADLEKAMLAISSRRGVNCLPSFLPLAQSSDVEVRLVALHVLSSVGGPAALAAVKTATDDKDEAVQDEAVRTLATWPSNWPEDSSVAEPLLALAKSGKKPSYKVLGLRGYLACVQGDKKLKDDEKVASVKDLLPLITRPEEKRQAVSVLGSTPTAGALELLVSFTSDPEISEEACLAVVTLVARTDVKGASKELLQKSLQTAAEKAKTDKTKQKAQEVLKRIS